jgi:hypothetical protein
MRSVQWAVVLPMIRTEPEPHQVSHRTYGRRFSVYLVRSAYDRRCGALDGLVSLERGHTHCNPCNSFDQLAIDFRARNPA